MNANQTSMPVCPDCGSPSQWATVVGTGQRTPAVCRKCVESLCDVDQREEERDLESLDCGDDCDPR